jgi:hypothetical protein
MVKSALAAEHIRPLRKSVSLAAYAIVDRSGQGRIDRVPEQGATGFD